MTTNNQRPSQGRSSQALRRREHHPVETITMRMTITKTIIMKTAVLPGEKRVPLRRNPQMVRIIRKRTKPPRLFYLL